MKVCVVTTFFALLFLFVTPRAHALLEFEDGVFPELATNGRALAMGNAYMSKVDDAAAAFYNPAGLGTVRYTHLHLSNLHLETNKGWIDVATGGNITDFFSNISDGFSLDGVRTLLNNNKGKLSHMRFHLAPNFTTRFLSIGYLYAKQTRATLGLEPGALIEIADRRDMGPYMAMNLSIGGGVFKVGVMGILLSRKEIIQDLDATAAIDLQDSDYNEGTGAIINTGARLTIPFMWLPTFSFVWHNTFDQTFSTKSGSAGAPDKIKPAMDVGFSITPNMGRASRWHFEVVYRDLTGEHDLSSIRRLGAGMEFDFGRKVFIRFGYGDGFGSAGLGIRTQKLEFDLTTYAVDTTSSELRGEEDRRFSMTLSSGF